MPNTLLNAEALAEYLGCSVRLVRRLDRRGVLPRVEVGRLVRYDAEAVLKALQREPVTRLTHRVVGGGLDIPHRGAYVPVPRELLNYMDRNPSLQQVGDRRSL